MHRLVHSRHHGVDADGIPTTFERGANFGTGTQNTHYPVARTFQFGVGFRF